MIRCVLSGHTLWQAKNTGLVHRRGLLHDDVLVTSCDRITDHPFGLVAFASEASHSMSRYVDYIIAVVFLVPK